MYKIYVVDINGFTLGTKYTIEKNIKVWYDN